jgi:hypothetical protein
LVGHLVRSKKSERVELADVRRHRRGKHHDLVEGCFRIWNHCPQVQQSKSRAEAGRWHYVGKPAIRRSSSGLGIETLFDEENFYIWKAGNRRVFAAPTL